MNHTFKKTLSFAAKIILYGVLWIIAFFIGLLIVAIAHFSEEEILLGGFDLLVLMIFSCTSSWFFGRKIRNLFSPKLHSSKDALVEPVLASETNIIVTSPIEPVIEPIIVPNAKPDVLEHTLPIANKQPIPTLELIDAMDGHEFEYWCADLLRDNGFTNVSVTRGSGDQGVDVLAEKEGIRYAIQCKCYSHDLSNKPVQEVHAGKTIYHCHIGAVITNRHFTKGAKEAAESTGVLLWDRDWIKERLKGTETTQQQPAIDPLLWDALELVRAANCATPTIVKRGLGIGYARAARIVDQLEELGYVGPFRGSRPREIL